MAKCGRWMFPRRLPKRNSIVIRWKRACSRRAAVRAAVGGHHARRLIGRRARRTPAAGETPALRCRIPAMRKLLLILLLTAVPVLAKEVLPFIDNDYSKALAEAKRKNVPVFVDAWAPW